MSEELQKWRDNHLNSISPSFCAAKWYNASLHLGHGYTNSCHLPIPHPIPVEEVPDNPAVLHNTELKKQARKLMLEGKRPAECSYCWKVEDIGRNNVADRVYKSQIYKVEDIEILKDQPWDKDVLLKTVEVSFDRICNFACSYCNAGYSTTWGNDINKSGPYQKFKSNSAGAYQSNGSWADRFGKNSDNNPYVEGFIQWWPELIQELEELRITGGEPSASPNFWKFLETVKKHPSGKLRLAVNSNMGMKKDILEKLINVTHELPIKEFDLYTSNESYGPHAEYIRDGLIYEEWRANLVNFIKNANIRAVTMMMTINSLCLFSITEFMDDMILLKKEFGWHRPHLDLNILRWPAFMSPLSLPDDIKKELHSKLSTWFKKYETSNLLNEGEKQQIKRLIDYIEVVHRGHVSTELDLPTHFHDFKSFYEQYDKRRGKSFVDTFPYLKDWYDSIEVDRTIPNVEVSSGGIQHWETGEYKETY